MSKIKDGGPAFPVPNYIKDLGTGLTLRDYFAAKAMAGFLSSGRVNPDHAAGIFADEVSQKAYALADAMLEAREK